ncbi:MAG: hypothetical protein ACREAM_08910 [Blastocatellia bacterium]
MNQQRPTKQAANAGPDQLRKKQSRRLALFAFFRAGKLDLGASPLAGIAAIGHWINPGRPPRREVASHERHAHKQEPDQRKRRRISRAHFVEQAPYQAGHCHRRHQAGAYSDQGQDQCAQPGSCSTGSLASVEGGGKVAAAHSSCAA